MKRVLFALFLVASLAACSKENTVATAPKLPISFGNVFVENSTRADESVLDESVFHTTSNLSEFFVYGNVKGDSNTAKLYQHDRVYIPSGATSWWCDAIQYWIAGCTYNFAAVTDVAAEAVKVDENGMPTTIDYDAGSQKDLLYAENKNITTNAQSEPSVGVTSGHVNPVPFTFNHLLSKVMFTFRNGFSSDSDVHLKVVDIKIHNAAKTATYKVNDTDATPTYKWDGAEKTYFATLDTNGDLVSPDGTLDFGNTGVFGPAVVGESKSRLLIPNSQQYYVTFTIEHDKSETKTYKTIITQEIELNQGQFYHFSTVLDSQNVEGVAEVKFTITVNNNGGWEEDNGNGDIGPVYPYE